MKIGLNVKLGIVAGIVNCLLWYFVAKSLNYYSLDVDRYRYYGTLLLLLSGIFISVSFERKNNNGYIEFKNAAKCGILFSIVLALILALFNFIYYGYIVPDAVDYFISEAKKKMIEEKTNPVEMAKYTELIKNYFGFFRMLMSTIIIGVILSLVAGAMFRKKDPHTLSAN